LLAGLVFQLVAELAVTLLQLQHQGWPRTSVAKQEKGRHAEEGAQQEGLGLSRRDWTVRFSEEHHLFLLVARAHFNVWEVCAQRRRSSKHYALGF
jgi:hypothetical protein